MWPSFTNILYIKASIFLFIKIEREQLLVGFCEFLEYEIPEEVSKEKSANEEQDDGKFGLTLFRFGFC